MHQLAEHGDGDQANRSDDDCIDNRLHFDLPSGQGRQHASHEHCENRIGQTTAHSIGQSHKAEAKYEQATGDSQPSPATLADQCCTQNRVDAKALKRNALTDGRRSQINRQAPQAFEDPSL